MAELRCSRVGGREKQKLGDVLGLLVKGRLPHVDVRARGGSEGNDPSPPPFQAPKQVHQHLS